MAYDMTKRMQRKKDREHKAEQLLRTKDYSAKELSAALPYELSHTRLLIHDLMGRERSLRRIFISGWDVKRKVRGYVCTPRYRWVTNAEANVPRPSAEECLARLKWAPGGPVIAPPAGNPSAHADLMTALYKRAA